MIRKIPGYELIAEIHESAYSLVYRGRRSEDNQPVILKVLKQDYPNSAEITKYKQQFEITQNLNFDGVAKAYSLEKYQNSLVMTLEDFGGESLKKVIKKTTLNLAEFLKIAIKISETLAEIHAAKIIHKDINPYNIVFNPDTQQVKIIDFGIATVLSQEKTAIKNPNVLGGTLAYMSPEQTGRMNRALDYRTDFYSLGVTFYELLTHQLPFVSNDVMELVHSHLAKKPIPPHEINPEIPKAISDIVIKLLAKTAEERYQSGLGLKADLETCLQQLQDNGVIEEFPLGSKDTFSKFQIPQKLYGRQNEIYTLLSTFLRVTQGTCEMMLVSGYSGIGKSALIQEIYQPITQTRGYFCSGKFEQFQRNIPYSAVVNAFQFLIRQLLTESEVQLEKWKQKLLTAFGPNGQVIIDVIPDIELIVGPQPPVAELGPSESQNRFNLVFQNFIQVFCSVNHPLVIFLDDLQWADSASLKLIELMMTNIETQYLFLIGAYRDNEVFSAHPLNMTLQILRQQNVIIHEIHLAPLSSQEINHLVAETVHEKLETVEPLAELIYRKTEGNPFFVNEFLKTLYQENLLAFDHKQRSWQWDIHQIEAKGITDSIVELMIGKLRKLPQATQEVLRLAAYIGNYFDLKTLALVCEQSPPETFQFLLPAIQEGLVIPTSELEATHSEITNIYLLIYNYKFLHDRVQQAAYALTPSQEHQALHLKIGRLLLQDTPTEQVIERIFDLVDHLNFGADLITDFEEKIHLVRLNLEAGKKAKDSLAYASALKYLTTGRQGLPSNSWENYYSLTWEVYKECAEAEYLNGRFEKSEQLIHEIATQSSSPLEKADLYNLLIIQHTLRANYEEAIQVGRQALEWLNIELPFTQLHSALEQELKQVKQHLETQNIEDLLNAPSVSLPDKKVALKLLNHLAAPAYLSNQELYGIIVSRIVNISLKYGSAPESSHGYSGYGILLVSMVHNYSLAYQVGILAIRLTERFNTSAQRCQSSLLFSGYINSWTKPIRNTNPILNEAYKLALESGNLQFAGYSLTHQSINNFYQGKTLEAMSEELPKFLKFVRKTQNQWSYDAILGIKLAVFYLIEQSNNVTEVAYLERCQENQSYAWICTYKILKAQIYYLQEKPTEALDCLVSASTLLNYIPGQISIAEHNFYYSLVLAAIYSNASPQKQTLIWEQLISNQKEMKLWADSCPENFLHKYLLVNAELARLQENYWEASELYDAAIASASENEFIQNEALANELAAKFWQKKEKIAKLYMTKAHYCYQRWGAVIKTKELEEKYPHLIARQSVTPNYQEPLNITSTPTNNTQGTGVLDLATVMKASQAISEEIVLDKLLEKLTRLLVENAGAQKGFLVLESEGNWTIEAQSGVDSEQVTILHSLPLEEFKDERQSSPLSTAVVNYVIRTQKNVVLHNAAEEGQFTHDSYILATRPKSVLCTPLFYKGELKGVIYLENNLTTDAFTPDRLEVLKLLSSQVAVSLENARLYTNSQRFSQNLEKLVEERTEELSLKNQQLEQAYQQLTDAVENLQQTQSQLIQTEKMSSLGQMVAGIAHEINNPVNFIYGNITHVSRYINDLLNLVNLYQEECADSSVEIQDFIEEIDLEFVAEDLPKTVSSIKIGAERIAQIVLSLRNFSRLDEAEVKSTNVHEGIDNSLLILNHRIKQGVEIVKDYGELPLIECYPAQLNQVFMNILNNAIDALLGSDCVNNKQIFIKTQRLGDLQIQVCIRDNGLGIPQDIQSKLFDPFFTTKPVGKGTGLGLSICYQIIEKHRGEITVNSEIGKGTEFVITLPVKLSVNPQ